MNSNPQQPSNMHQGQMQMGGHHGLEEEEIGLKLSSKIHSEYGREFQAKPRDRASGYANCIKCCGAIPKFFCCLCAACDCGPVRKIPTGMIGLKSEFGKLKEKLEPGLHSFNQCSESITIVDLRAQIINIPPQQLLTRDNVSVTVDAFVTFKILLPELAVYKVQNYVTLVTLMTQGVMKTIVAERGLNDLLVNRQEIEKAITEIIDKKTDDYGIKVISIDTKGIVLPPSMERAMATVAESKKESEAKIIDAQGNLESSKIFRQAADELSINPISLQLQYFETLKNIAAEKNSTIIVPDSILSSIKK